MNVIFGPEILLLTKYGRFDITHIEVSSQHGLIKEGVLLKRDLSDKENILVRVQSSCLFSESFWTTNCDCSLQLQTAMQMIAENGGYVLYFYEEGRGAGLKAKFKAIELQQIHDFNTQQAYECLNINVDQRNYEAAAAVLKEVVFDKPIILLTNNPGKVEGLERHGIKIKNREPLIRADTPEIKKYLEEKRDSLGHIIP